MHLNKIKSMTVKNFRLVNRTNPRNVIEGTWRTEFSLAKILHSQRRNLVDYTVEQRDGGKIIVTYAVECLDPLRLAYDDKIAPL
jgi:hypothetical protein